MSVVTVGDFDGVHTGHKALLRQVVQFASAQDLPAVVVTFDRNCKQFLHQSPREFLTDTEEKRQLLLAEGIDTVCVVPFDEAFSQMSSQEFLLFLKEHCGCTHLFGGEDFCFGRGGQASLTDGTSECGISQHVVDLKADVMKISSTSIRAALREGLVERANQWLGYEYFLSGTVVEGKHLGRTIGFPTVNLEAPAGKIIPGNGVYITETTVNGKTYRSITNVGVRPTVHDGGGRNVETHLLQADGDFYGKNVTVRFLTRLRNEMHFSDLGDLMQQLKIDRDMAFVWHNTQYFS